MEQEYTDKNLIPSSELSKEIDNMESIAKVLKAIVNFPNTMRRKFKGEYLYVDEEGKSFWVQGTKPSFVVMDHKTQKPKKINKKMPWGEMKEIYIANDEAIDEIISMIEFMGVNEINPVGFNSPDNYLDDLKEFECKLAGLLALKQKEWGMDKELLPMIMIKIKTLVQDVRSLAIKGNLIRAITTNMQRIEQYIQNDSQKKGAIPNPY